MTRHEPPPDRDDALARLSEEVERLLAAGEEPDAPALAARFGVEPEDVDACVASLRVLGDALFSDLDVEVPLPPPELPDDYEILEEIGRGGMGVVYRARQVSLDRVVAVKVVRPASLGFEGTVRRFRREARSLARLRHPGIVSIHEVGTAGDSVWFAMDLVEGESLASRLREGALNPGEAVRIVAQAASAVVHAHGRGIVHRDLKPANVLLDREGDAWVVDFGLAHEEGMSLDATGTGRLIGTPAYMSPEQARGDADAVGEGTDVYALGALLHECLSGQPLFKRNSLADLIHAVLHHEPAPLRQVDPRLPRDLETIILKATAKRPEARYPTVRALLSDLRAWLDGVPIRAKRPGKAYALGRFVRLRWRSLAAIAATAGLAAAIVLLFVVPRIGRTPQTLFLTARDLSERGEPGAAMVLFAQAAEKHGRDRTDAFAVRIHRFLATARAGQVRILLLRGELDEAETLAKLTLADAERVLGEATRWVGQERFLWDLARIDGARGDLTEMARRLHQMDHRLSSMAWREQGIDRFPDRSSSAVLDCIEETLGDASPLREVALRALGERSIWVGASGIANRIADRGRDEALEILEELIRAEAHPATRELTLRTRLIDALRERGAASAAEAMLARLASGEAETDRVRATAMMHLVVTADLPGNLEYSDPRTRSPAWDATQAGTLLELWEDTREASFADALRARFDMAVAIGDVGWLMAHTGLGYREVPDWPAWWAERRDGEPSQWFKPSVAEVESDVSYRGQILVDRLSRPLSRATADLFDEGPESLREIGDPFEFPG